MFENNISEISELVMMLSFVTGVSVIVFIAYSLLKSDKSLEKRPKK